MNSFCIGLLVVFFCTAEKPTVVSEYCKTYQIVQPSRNDTPGTKRQILRENSKYRRICQGRK